MEKLKVVSLAFLFSIMFGTNSCSFNNKFTVFTQNPNLSSSKYLRIDGVYISQNDELADTIYFYSNGIIGLKSFGYGGNANPNGHYIIRDDSLIGQYFGRDAGGSTQIYVNEIFGKISNDTTFYIIAIKCEFCVGVYAGWNDSSKKYFKPPLEFNFKKTIKKDSSIAWFKNKKWYLKNVWNSNE